MGDPETKGIVIYFFQLFLLEIPGRSKDKIHDLLQMEIQKKMVIYKYLILKYFRNRLSLNNDHIFGI